MKAAKATAYLKWRKKVFFIFILFYYFFTVFLYISDSQQQIFFGKIYWKPKKADFDLA